MQKKLNVKFWIIARTIKWTAAALLIYSLLACGGGSGSGGTESSAATCTKNSAIDLSIPINDVIEKDKTYCFKFDASENTSYKVTAQSISGDVDIAAHNSSNMDALSIIVFSINPLNIPDELIFTVDSSSEHFIELYGFETSEYSLEVREVDTSEYLSVNTNYAALSGISTHSLPTNQQLTQPDIGTQQVSATFNPSAGNSPDTSFSISSAFTSTAPDWLSFNITNSSLNTTDYEYAVTRTDLPAGAYETQARLTHIYGTNIHVFQDINLSYSLSEPPFSSQPSNTHIATANTIYSFNIDVNSQETPSYNIEYGPNGMTVDNTGLVSWPASMPMFTDTMNINWGISVTSNGVTVLHEDSITLTNATFSEPLVRTGRAFSEFVSEGNMVSADWDDDGKTEIILSDMEKVLYSLEYEDSDYIEDWVNPFSLSDKHSINTLASADLNQDGIEELIIGTWHRENVSSTAYAAEVLIMDGVNKQIVNSTRVDVEVIQSIYSGDIDNDGNIELVVFGRTYTNDSLVRIYEGVALSPEWGSTPLTRPYGAPITIKLGNIDTDPALEIVTGMGHIIDGLTHSIEVIKTEGFPGHSMAVTVGDADNDGIEDIVHATNDYMFIYDGTGALKYQFDSSQLPQFYSGRFEYVIVGDISDQGNNHLIVSVENTIDEIGFYKFNTTTSTFDVDYRVNSFSSVPESLILDDFDNDNSTELLWREGGRSTGTDGLVVAGLNPDIGEVEIEWYTDNPSEYNFNGFFTPQFVTNLSSEDKIWFISNDSDELDSDGVSDAGPRLLNLDLATKKLSVAEPIYNSSGSGYIGACNNISSFLSDDINLDTIQDAIVAPCQFNHPAIAINLEDSSTIQSSSLTLTTSDSGQIKAMAVGDFGSDDSLEVAVVTQYGDIYVYNPLSNKVLWEYDSEFVSSRGVNVFITDTDNNGSNELVIVLNTKIVFYSYNPIDSSFSLDKELILDDASSAVVSDLNGDSIDEIAVLHGGYLNQYLTLYDINLAPITTYPVDYHVDSMYLENLPGENKNILIATSGPFSGVGGGVPINRIRAFNPYTGSEVWSSPNLLGDIPTNSLKYVDINGDNFKELFFTTDKAINVIY